MKTNIKSKACHPKTEAQIKKFMEEERFFHCGILPVVADDLLFYEVRHRKKLTVNGSVYVVKLIKLKKK